MDITVNIKAPDLAGAIKALAEAIGYSVAAQEGKALPPAESILKQISAPEEPEETIAPEPEEKPKSKPARKAAAKPAEPEPQPEPELEPDPEFVLPWNDLGSVTNMDELRQAFVAKNTPSNRPKLKAILNELGAAKITELPEQLWPQAMAKLEAL